MSEISNIEQKIINYGKREGSVPPIADAESAQILRQWMRKPVVNSKVIIDIDPKSAEREKIQKEAVEANKIKWKGRGEEMGRKYSRWVNTEEGRQKAEENLQMLREADDKGRGFVDRLISSKKLKDKEMEVFLVHLENEDRSLITGSVADRIFNGLSKMEVTSEDRSKLMDELREWRMALKLKEDMDKHQSNIIYYLSRYSGRNSSLLISDAEVTATGEGIRKGWEEVMVKSKDGKQKNSGGNI